MKITNQQEMENFCKHAVGRHPFGLSFSDRVSDEEVKSWEELKADLTAGGILMPGGELLQGILEIGSSEGGGYAIEEVPRVYPAPKILAEHKDLTGACTGVLVNCYDPKSQTLLYHMRGKAVDTPFQFQAAAAGFGKFREHLAETAARELAEEAGIHYPRKLFKGKAMDVMAFMKGTIPQPLFSFGFANDLSRFPICRNLGEVVEFEGRTKAEISKGDAKLNLEGYHFAIPYAALEETVGRLNDGKKLFGPIYESTINFIRALKDSGAI